LQETVDTNATLELGDTMVAVAGLDVNEPVVTNNSPF
jgi:hypothetical protein